ncbi:MAG: hypothetical protein V1753_02005 [Pseudomonadota bacterium]
MQRLAEGLAAVKKIFVQIYEVQDPFEADALIGLGVDHIGSVLLDKDAWRQSLLKDVVRVSREKGVKNSFIPLFSAQDTILHAAEYYSPDIMHFCDRLTDNHGKKGVFVSIIKLQKAVKERFPEIKIMRSIPISVHKGLIRAETLEIAKELEPVSDYFLIDTWLEKEPVEGFIGVTGRLCDWETASQLVAATTIPVILAGGMSPDNVFEGICKVRPFGVDSCTGTNATSFNGKPVRFKKDLGKVKRFIEETRRAEKTLL